MDPREERQRERLARLEEEYQRLTAELAQLKRQEPELSGAERAKAAWLESRLTEIERWRRQIKARLGQATE